MTERSPNSFSRVLGVRCTLNIFYGRCEKMAQIGTPEVSKCRRLCCCQAAKQNHKLLEHRRKPVWCHEVKKNPLTQLVPSQSLGGAFKAVEKY